MKTKNCVFIATSIDGHIADKDGNIDWLHAIPNPEGIDMGYRDFMADIDAIVMGRNTFQTVCGFDIEWPYSKPVFALSTTLTRLDPIYEEKVTILSGSPREICQQINSRGFRRLYIDGGTTIQHFLEEDLIDEMTITTIPILLGGGVPLFGELGNPLSFRCVSTQIYLEQVVQQHYVRVR